MNSFKKSWRSLSIFFALIAVAYVAQGCQFGALHPRAVCVGYSGIAQLFGRIFSGVDPFIYLTAFSILTFHVPLAVALLYLAYKQKEIESRALRVVLFVLPVFIVASSSLGIPNFIRPVPKILACAPVVSEVTLYATSPDCAECTIQEKQLRQTAYASLVKRVNTPALFENVKNNPDELPSVGWGIEEAPFEPSIRVDFVDAGGDEGCLFEPLLYRDRALVKGDEYSVSSITADIEKYILEKSSYSEY